MRIPNVIKDYQILFKGLSQTIKNSNFCNSSYSWGKLTGKIFTNFWPHKEQWLFHSNCLLKHGRYSAWQKLLQVRALFAWGGVDLISVFMAAHSNGQAKFGWRPPLECRAVTPIYTVWSLFQLFRISWANFCWIFSSKWTLPLHARRYALVWLVVPGFSSSLVPNGHF